MVPPKRDAPAPLPQEELQQLRLQGEVLRARADLDLQARRAAIERARVETEEILSQAALAAARLEQTTRAEMAALRLAKERAGLEADLAQARLLQQSAMQKTQLLTTADREGTGSASTLAPIAPARYLLNPVQADGSLVISDRRIPLNGLITIDSAEALCARIDYFNTQSTKYPIFIVIDQSPGGSVMAGYKILKTMQSSTAPVYVVVKSFAASMAAAICTLAPHSFAYPNAIILHHQISNGSKGNLAAQRESVKILEQWWSRLAEPIAAKMGVTAEAFSREMFAHSTTGDWQEFADEAQKLKWVDRVVGICRETAFVQGPDFGYLGSTATASVPEGKATLASLPRLSPIDCYYLYNPDGYFRAE